MPGTPKFNRLNEADQQALIKHVLSEDSSLQEYKDKASTSADAADRWTDAVELAAHQFTNDPLVRERVRAHIPKQPGSRDR